MPREHLETAEQKHEYDFESGVAEALRRIEELLEHTDHDLVVLVNGSSIEVGKTRVESRLRRELMERDVETSGLPDLTQYDLRWNQEHLTKRPGSNPHTVYFYTSLGRQLRKGQEYNRTYNHSEDFLPIDFSIAIYRPDRPFRLDEGFEPMGDIIIRNDAATNR